MRSGKEKGARKQVSNSRDVGGSICYGILGIKLKVQLDLVCYKISSVLYLNNLLRISINPLLANFLMGKAIKFICLINKGLLSRYSAKQRIYKDIKIMLLSLPEREIQVNESRQSNGETIFQLWQETQRCGSTLRRDLRSQGKSYLKASFLERLTFSDFKGPSSALGCSPLHLGLIL